MTMDNQIETTLKEAGEVLHDLLDWVAYMGWSESAVWERAEAVMRKIETLNRATVEQKLQAGGHPEDINIPLYELTYELLLKAGAVSVGREYLGTPGDSVCFTRYFNAEKHEVAYASIVGVPVVHFFGTPRVWGVELPSLTQLSEYNWAP
jgi:hypothetical protein